MNDPVAKPMIPASIVVTSPTILVEIDLVDNQMTYIGT